MYDPEARTGKKREVTWLGYKVHLTETCAVDATQDAQAKAMPQFIVEVQTSVANLQDVEATALIQEDLAQHELLPEDQIVDTGYVDAELLLSSQEQYGIRLLGRSCLTLVGSPKQAKVSMRRTSSSIGQASKPLAHKDSRVPAGVERATGSKWFLPLKCVRTVPCAATVRGPRRPVACCICVRRRHMRLCRPDDRNRRRRNFASGMPFEQASRGRPRKGCVAWGYVGPGMMACTRRTYSTS